MSNISAKIFEAASTKPYGGFEIADDSYLYRSPFGQVDLFASVFCTTVQSKWHTIAMIPDGFGPNTYRKVEARVVNNDGTCTTIECYCYANGNINVFNILPTGQYTIEVFGSYLIL